MLKKLLLAATASLALAAPAIAHRAWLLPSITTLSDANQGVTVDAATSTEPFSADHFPMNTDGIQATAPDGSTGKIENAAKGRYRATFDVMIDKPGTWRIGSSSDGVSGTFSVNGERWSVGRRRGGGGPGPGAGVGAPGENPGQARREGGPARAGGQAPARAGGEPGDEGGARRQPIDPSHVVATAAEIPAGATDLDLTQNQSRNEFFVTAGAPTETVFRPTNKGLEMVPITHPTDLVSDEPGKFRFLVDGKPAAGLGVTFVPGGQRYRDGEKAQEIKADSNGVVTVSWPVAGFYWMNASLSDDKPTAPRANKRRMSYTATLEVVAP